MVRNQFSNEIFYAIAIEEIEAWVLTIYIDKQRDTCRYNDPKTELNRVLSRKLSQKKRKVLSLGNELIKFDKLSKGFGKARKLSRANLFCKSLEAIHRT